jgi:aryl-alcohol dehydrogenase-like predicted oxidoreductase
MKTQKLGSSDLEIPIVCLGTMTWGVQNTEEEAHQQLDYAVDERGIKFIDTAEIYPVPPSYDLQGLTETYIGNWISKRGKRDDLIIATKVSPAPIIRTREETGAGAKLDRKSIREAVEGSLKRLQIDYIDLYQVHWPERPVDKFGERGYQHDDGGHTSIEETLTALTELITEGKIRYIGLSNENPYGVSEFLRLAREKGLAKIVSIQNQYSLLNRKYEMANAELCLKNEVGLLAYSALSMGVLSGKYLDGARPKGARMSESMRNSHYNSDLVQEPTRRYVELAKKHGIDPSTLALQFAASRPFTASVIIGATTMEQLKANIDAFETPLPEKLKQEIEKIYLKFPDPHA